MLKNADSLQKDLKKKEEKSQEDGGNISRRWRNTAVKPEIYGLAFTMGKWFLTENSATVGRILMISSADPHEILTLRKW